MGRARGSTSRRPERYQGLGESPQLSRGPTQGKTSNNKIREFLKTLQNNPEAGEESDVMTCPTSATSDNGQATEDEEYLSMERCKRTMERPGRRQME